MDFLLTLSGPILYLVIFFAKIVEVTLMTLRVVYVNKGEKLIGAFLGFFEVLIWIIIVSSVLNNISEDPMKILVYCSAFALGNYIGVTIESKLAMGLASLQVVVNDVDGENLADILREQGFGVTIIEGKGKNDSKKDLLFIQLKRKRIIEAVKLIQNSYEDAFITVNDIKSLRGGFVKK